MGLPLISAALAAVAWAAILFSDCAIAMTRPGSEEKVAQSIEGDVTEILSFSPLRFTLSCCDAVLELKLVEARDLSRDNLTAIRKVLEEQRWHCTAFNEAPTDGIGPAGFVWCNGEDGTLLSQFLMERGLVVERCGYSGNQFGTC